MQKVLVFCGVKQSGKSTSAKFVTAHRMQQAGHLKWFEIEETTGDLLVSSGVLGIDGKIKETKGVLDLNRLDEEFAEYAGHRIWPHAKIYHFSEELKNAAIDIFGLNPKCVYGTDEDKNKLTHIKWKNMWDFLSKDEKTVIALRYNFNLLDGPPDNLYMTYREFLQEFGTTICRKIYDGCWVNATWRKILGEGWPYVIIDDGRFENEVLLSKEYGAHLVLLTRTPYVDNHKSERIHELDRNLFDTVIDNQKLNIEKTNHELIKLLDKAGWNTGELV